MSSGQRLSFKTDLKVVVMARPFVILSGEILGCTADLC